VDRVARDALRRAHYFRVRREIGVLVVALGEVEGAFLLDAPRKHADERLGVERARAERPPACGVRGFCGMCGLAAVGRDDSGRYRSAAFVAMRNHAQQGHCTSAIALIA